ncbi:hypothetical protein ACFZAU_24165 [Streptomyces sp. NPDC008238]
MPGDEVVRALLTAVATLEDLVQVGHDAHTALSTLSPDERRRFLNALERVATDEPDQATWMLGLPDALGLDRP